MLVKSACLAVVDSALAADSADENDVGLVLAAVEVCARCVV
jgi:hypothetical protein